MIQIYLTNLQCHVETDEVGDDEPYVLATAVDLASFVSVAGFSVPLPAFEVVRYGPFQDVESPVSYDAPGISQSFWGVNDRPATLDNPDQAILVVALMENDDGDPEALRGIVKGIVGGSVLGSLSSDRADKVADLIRDVNSALGTPTGGPNFDEKVGHPQELRFSAEELRSAESAQRVCKTLFFEGDGGSYTLIFEAVRSHHVFGAIRQEWIGLGVERGPLGLPIGIELPTFGGTGRAQAFQGGLISWHPETGAHAVWGLIGKRWLEIGREQFGYPITDETPTSDGRGRFNHFRALQLPGRPDSSIYWHPDTGAHEVYGAIRHHWAGLGWERSHLGYPITAEHDHAGGRIQRFQGGSLFWTPHGGVVVQ